MSYIEMSTGSIKNKNSSKREPFVIFGFYEDLQALKNKMKSDFDPIDYDYRTIKFADCIKFPYLKEPQIFNLEYLAEDLGVA